MPRSLEMPRVVKGKRPQFFASPNEDFAISMIMVLAQEFSVMRARLDAFENIVATKGVLDAQEIESYVADDSTLARQEKWRQDLLDRLFYLLHQKAAEVEADDTQERFQHVIEDLARP